MYNLGSCFTPYFACNGFLQKIYVLSQKSVTHISSPPFFALAFLFRGNLATSFYFDKPADKETTGLSFFKEKKKLPIYEYRQPEYAQMLYALPF